MKSDASLLNENSELKSMLGYYVTLLWKPTPAKHSLPDSALLELTQKPGPAPGQGAVLDTISKVTHV